MVDEGSLKTMYATKRRRRSIKTVKAPMKDPPKSNPSKRHRLRLNAELDHLASLLPFEQSVISKLDKLSILRLAVSYLRTKSYFQGMYYFHPAQEKTDIAILHERYPLDSHLSGHHSHLYPDPGFAECDSVLQALSGFLFVVSCDGEVFFASRTVEQYLGFHQSDIIHQSALELIHSEDREEFKNHLNWREKLPQDKSNMTLQEVLLPENQHLLQRSFTVRFRCLLDNTSGFITLEINGRIKILHGQSLKQGTEEPPLSLFALCCPFGPLPMLDMPPRDFTFKTKHKMDLAPISMDHRGKLLFGYSDRELATKGGYDLAHPDDLSYFAAAHQELIKTGSSGLIAYRFQAKDLSWIWLQTSSKVVYKNSKPDFVICTHRQLSEDEGRDLLGKRGTEFKLPYPLLDTDTSGFDGCEEDSTGKGKSQRTKKSKTQLREYLHTGRKRKSSYRDAFNGLNGYSPYTGMNAYPGSCQTGEMKPEIMYPYTGNNYSLETDIYRSQCYPSFTGSVYPTTDSYRLEAEKAYSNGYYLDSRQYQHSLQYHSNGYPDLVAPSTKYSYDVSKYGYDMSSFGLDLSKRGHFDDELSRLESDFRKYSHDYSAEKLSHRLNGGLEPLKSSAIYSTPGVLNNEAYMSSSGMTGITNSMSHSVVAGINSPCSLYRAEPTGSGGSNGSSTDKYNSQVLSSKEAKVMKVSELSNNSDPSKSQLHNGHGSVIRSTSPRTKSPRSVLVAEQRQNGISVITGGGGATYHPDPNSSSLPQCSSSTWSTCIKANDHMSHKSSPRSTPSSHSHDNNILPNTSPAVVSAPTLQLDLHASKIVSPASNRQESVVAYSNSSPASATTATSVIQQSVRRGSCDKQSIVPGGIAVPVVKSSWLHHLPTAYSADPYSSDSYSCHQRSLYPAGTDASKYGTMKQDERQEESNPLLSFSEVTHTLLNVE